MPGAGEVRHDAGGAERERSLGALLKIGEVAYPERVRTLRKGIQARAQLFAGKRWQRSAAADFA